MAKKTAAKKKAKPAAASMPSIPVVGAAAINRWVEEEKRNRKAAALFEALRRQDQHWRDMHPGIVKPNFVQALRQTPNNGIFI